MRRHGARAALGLLLAALAAWGAETVAHPYRGVAYIERTETAPRSERMHIVLVDLRAPGIRFKLSPPGGARECVRQSTLDFLKQEHAQVAINAHYFLPFPSPDTDAFVVGLAASEGKVYSGFETPEQSYALVKDAPALNIDPENRVAIVHRDPAFADGMHVREKVTLWNALAGSAEIVTDGAATIPRYGVELTAGGPRNYSAENSWYERVTARTAIGVTRDGNTLVLFTVDARGGSAGMKVSEVAEMLIRDYGVWEALNLDGGGSTTMAIGDRIVNTSSDNPHGRRVASSLAVFAEPAATR
jgi:exopolysaccharide biosynthesis protein